MRRLAPLLTALAVVFTACGGGDGADAGYRDLIAGQLAKPGGTGGQLVVTEAEAECASSAIVASFGAARLNELGYDPAGGSVPNPDFLGPDLAGAERRAWFEAIDGCVDLEAQMVTMFEGFGLAPEVAACVAGAYSASGLVEDALMTNVYDADLNDRIDATVSQAVTDCGG